jgi:phosphoglycerate dehydrogenase-like enzyme
LVQHAPAWLDIVIVDEADTAIFTVAMQDAHVLLHVLEPVTAGVIAAAPQLRLIHKIGVGVNTIDLDAARQRGIAVANMPGTNTPAVAELTLLLMLATLRRVAFWDTTTRQKKGWETELQVHAVLDTLGELNGRLVGHVGYGAVAAHLAPILHACGAAVVYTARQARPQAVGKPCSFDELLRVSDIVSLHVPLTPETTRLMDAAAFARMKPGSVFINTARGGLVDEPALIAALQSGHLCAAGLDVFADEPIHADNPLLTLDNVVVTPHIGWLTPETLGRSCTIAFENCRRLRAGEPLLHRVM